MKINKAIIFIIAIILLLIIGMKYTMNKPTKVKLQTNMGDIAIELYDDMPITAGFMIQGGDSRGTGMGGPGYTIKDEFTHKEGNKNNRGTISMANAGPNTGGSQFFINLVDNNFLDSKHPAFGEIIEGMNVVDKISKVKTDANDKPIEEVKIIKAEIIN